MRKFGGDAAGPAERLCGGGVSTSTMGVVLSKPAAGESETRMGFEVEFPEGKFDKEFTDVIGGMIDGNRETKGTGYETGPDCTESESTTENIKAEG